MLVDDMIAVIIGHIVGFSIDIGVSFYQPLLILLGISQANLIIILWGSQVLYLLICIGKKVMNDLN
jgi:hypothetical protein